MTFLTWFIKLSLCGIGIVGAGFCFHEAVWWRENRYESSPVIWFVAAGTVLLLLGVTAGAL